ncbi:protein translocase subunit SecD [Qipengyuania sp. 1NDH17]|uniref:Protein translocase subunit SecD n=1 Tax=Qipengyuania polymorpha TaxID=2867234 RepID=A0ABS7IUM2_9SPHN|nr:protein translocase subunit SecD [Qipengyuania polymorpha]MBX7456883.1 protein translocase subunit SecD [Qipengyuania polymorpha]
MLEFPTWKKVMLWGIAVLGILLALPSLASLSNQQWPDALPEPTVNLGLDLAGGSHILLEAEREQVAAKRLEDMEEGVRSALRGRDVAERIRIGDVSTDDGQLSFLLNDAGDIDRARAKIEGLINGTGTVREWDLQVVDGQRFVLSQTEAGLDNAVSSAMDAALSVINDRIDSLGTREPTVIRQGDTRIVVQVPGLQDPEALKELIGKTAQLEFKRVLRDATQAEVARGFVAGGEVVPYSVEEGIPGGGVVVERLGGIDGSTLTNARQGVDPQTNEAVVNIAFNAEGSRRFANLTTKYVGERFAIILDDQVISAPVMREPILNGQSQISGSFTVQTANNLAIQLSSGALPVDLSVVEERTVGPDLGADSIKQGLLAMGIGTLLVMLLMMITYGRFGIYATVALVINVLMLLGIMALMNATLTLPGIAGFVLTIGAAVDANVLINERIREERKRGRRVIAAVENGYKEASRAIYDANITNFIAGVLLFSFGSGPIKGFAVVLVVGLFTSVFTALPLTRMWVANWLRKTRPSDINL